MPGGAIPCPMCSRDVRRQASPPADTRRHLQLRAPEQMTLIKIMRLADLAQLRVSTAVDGPGNELRLCADPDTRQVSVIKRAMDRTHSIWA
jgi:hypothetical protein